MVISSQEGIQEILLLSVKLARSPRMQIGHVTILLRVHGGYNDREVRS
jgi:hypothetical protein